MNEGGVAKGLMLSVLDQSPVAAGSSPGQALQNSIELAGLVDRLGYRRYWMSEHHAMDTLACTAPEVMLARIGAETKRIRIGSGGIMLPHYTPLKRDRKTRMLDDFPEQVSELLAFLSHGEGHSFPAEHPFAGIRVQPEMPGGPDVWMLGSSMWSAAAAVEFGLPYSFAHFFSPVKTREAVEAYLREFRGSSYGDVPEATVAVGVICAETQEEAEYLAASVKLLQRRIRLGDRRPVVSPEDALNELDTLGEVPMEEGEWPRYFVGTPSRIRERLEQMARELAIGEVIVNTIIWDHEKRIKSYELLAGVFGFTGCRPAIQETV